MDLFYYSHYLYIIIKKKSKIYKKLRKCYPESNRIVADIKLDNVSVINSLIKLNSYKAIRI